MTSYKIEWKASAVKELRKLPKPVIARVLFAIETLAENPRPEGVRKLSGSENAYRIRIGDYRVIYCVFDRLLTIEVLRVRDRKDAYS